MSIATLTGLDASPRRKAGDGEWISLAEAARIVGCHPSTVKSAALAGGIRHRAVPGMRTTYSREDAKRLSR